MNIGWVFIAFIFFVLILMFMRNREHYKVAKDPVDIDMVERLKLDLAKLYPNLKDIDLNGLISCIPEDSYTENKKHVSICLRNTEGKYFPYSKLLKIGIHELAHVISKGYDPEHKTPEFNNNYSMLMKKARELGFQVE
jgi:hypothetical protein